MHKYTLIGKIESTSVYAEIRLKAKPQGKALSIIGVIGPTHDGDCHGGCDQIDKELRSSAIVAAPNVDLPRFLDIWREYHLNDMRPYCEHQRGWDFDALLQVQTYTQVGTRYADLEACSRLGRATDEEKHLLELSDSIYHKLVVGSSDPYPTEAIEELVKANMLAPWKIGSARAGWVYPYQNPDGLLCKPCPVCGYHYGSAWRFEPLPSDVIAFLEALPDDSDSYHWPLR